MSVYDDCFDIEDAIEKGEFPKDWQTPVSNVLEALTDEERKCLRLEERHRRNDMNLQSVEHELAEAQLKIKRLEHENEQLRQFYDRYENLVNSL